MHLLVFTYILTDVFLLKVKGIAIPLEAGTGLEVYRGLMHKDYKIIDT
jgi:hypothetical protein